MKKFIVLYACILSLLIFSGPAFGVTVQRKVTQEDIHWGDPTATVNDNGHVGHYLDNTYTLPATYTDLLAHLPTGYADDGSVDYSTEVQAWLDACTQSSSAGRHCTAPAGIFGLGGSIVVSEKFSFKVDGVGGDYRSNPPVSTNFGTIFKWLGAAGGTMFDFRGCRWFEFNNIRLEGDNTAGVGLQAQKENSPVIGSGMTDSMGFHNVWATNFINGVGLYIGQDNTSGMAVGLNGITIDNYNANFTKYGIKVDGLGGQAVRISGGMQYCGFIAGSVGVWMKTGELNSYGHNILSCQSNFFMDGVSVGSGIYGGYFEYGNGVDGGHYNFLRWGNHDLGGSLTITGTIHSGPTDNIVSYEGGTVNIISIGNQFSNVTDNAVIAAAGNQLIKLYSLNDIFPAGMGWIDNTVYKVAVICKGNQCKDGPEGSLDWNPSSGALLNNTGVTSSAITMDSAIAWGDACTVGAPYNLLGVEATCYPNDAPNSTVVIRLNNQTGSTFNGGSGTWRVYVKRKL